MGHNKINEVRSLKSTRRSYRIGSLGGVTQTIIKIMSLSPDRRAWVRATRDPPVPRPGTSSGPRTVGRCDVAPSRTHSWFSAFPSAETSLLPAPNTHVGPTQTHASVEKGPDANRAPLTRRSLPSSLDFSKAESFFRLENICFNRND